MKGPFNNLLLTRSINNLKSLNIFGDVEYDIKDDNDGKIININIVEKPTGEISAGAGTGTSGNTIGFVLEKTIFWENISLDTNLRLTKSPLKANLVLQPELEL